MHDDDPNSPPAVPCLLNSVGPYLISTRTNYQIYGKKTVIERKKRGGLKSVGRSNEKRLEMLLLPHQPPLPVIWLALHLHIYICCMHIAICACVRVYACVCTYVF